MAFQECIILRQNETTEELVWSILQEIGAFVTREDGEPFVFASGKIATLKIDAEALKNNQELLEKLLGVFAVHPCVQSADALSFAPNGMAYFAGLLAERIDKTVVHLVRPEGAARTDIEFCSNEDKELAQSIGTICLLEDISNTGLSADAAAQTLWGVNPNLEIHSLSMMQRGPIDKRYLDGLRRVTFHTLLRRNIPTDLQGFNRTYPDVSVRRI